MENFGKLLEIARRKSAFDQGNTWYAGPQTYLSAMRKEIDEVVEEIPKHRVCFLEDELSDVLWDYLNAVLALEKEAGIGLESVLRRACGKYQARVSGIESGASWQQIKRAQKQALAKEQASGTRA